MCFRSRQLGTCLVVQGDLEQAAVDNAERLTTLLLVFVCRGLLGGFTLRSLLPVLLAICCELYCFLGL